MKPLLVALSLAMNLTSPAFQNGGAIPAKYTCEGRDVSPPLAWSGVPPQAKSWVAYNLSPGASRIDEGAKALPAGARDGRNDWGPAMKPHVIAHAELVGTYQKR